MKIKIKTLELQEDKFIATLNDGDRKQLQDISPFIYDILIKRLAYGPIILNTKDTTYPFSVTSKEYVQEFFREVIIKDEK